MLDDNLLAMQHYYSVHILVTDSNGLSTNQHVVRDCLVVPPVTPLGRCTFPTQALFGYLNTAI